MVQPPVLPGGPPGNILRTNYIVHRGKCVSCKVTWSAFYIAERVELDSPKDGGA